jgi:hypothetical protein
LIKLGAKVRDQMGRGGVVKVVLAECLTDHFDAAFEFGLDDATNSQLVQLGNVGGAGRAGDDRKVRVEPARTVDGEVDRAQIGDGEQQNTGGLDLCGFQDFFATDIDRLPNTEWLSSTTTRGICARWRTRAAAWPLRP